MEKISHSQNSIACKFGITQLTVTTVTDHVILFPRKTKLRSISEISYIFLKKRSDSGFLSLMPLDLKGKTGDIGET